MREDMSGGDTGGDSDSDGDDDEVEASLDKYEEPLTKEREHLVPLLSSIVNKWREGEKTLRKNVK
jgi:hypothetical protein